MDGREQAVDLISIYMNLLRIKKAKDKESEIEDQLCEVRAQLTALGVVVDDLVIRRE